MSYENFNQLVAKEVALVLMTPDTNAQVALRPLLCDFDDGEHPFIGLFEGRARDYANSRAGCNQAGYCAIARDLNTDIQFTAQRAGTIDKVGVQRGARL